MKIRAVSRKKFIAFIAALAAILVASVIASGGAWGGGVGNDVDSGSGNDLSAQSPQAQPPPGFTSKFAIVNGFKMHYLQGGTGAPVVLIHGFPQTWAEWRQQMVPLAKNHTVIAVDLRGTGESQVTDSGYQTAQLANDVHQLLMQLRLNQGVQVVGHDIGLWVAYAYAAQWRSEVRRLAVMEAPIPDDSIFSFPALPDNPRTPSVWHFGLFQEQLAEQLIAGHERVFVRGFMQQWIANPSAFSSADYDFFARYLEEPGRTTAWLNIYRELRADVEQNKKFLAEGKLTMPVLAIGGEASFAGKVADQWRMYAENVYGEVLKGSGHYVTEEKPQELTAMLQTFLET